MFKILKNLKFCKSDSTVSKMSVYDYAQERESAQNSFRNLKSNVKSTKFARLKISPGAHARWEKKANAKLSVEFDYNSIMKNEVEKVQQFKDSVKLLDSNNHTQGLAHQIHLCFRTYVKEDIQGYIRNFGANDVTQGRVKAMLKVFSDHMMTILSKLVEGMSATYLGYLFKNVDCTDSTAKDPSFHDGFLKLADQWSNQNQLSPRTMDMSMSSIQSAISREIMCAPFDITTKEIRVPNEIKDSKYFSEPSKIGTNTSEDECPKTEKMYQRPESRNNAELKSKIAHLVLNDDNMTNISSSREKCNKSHRRLKNKLPKNSIKVFSKETSLDKMSPSQDTYPCSMSAVGRCISTKAFKNHTMLRNNSREETGTPILSMKSTTLNPTSYESNKENDSKLILEQQRAMAMTPSVEEPKLNPRKDEKNRQKLFNKFAISKAGASSRVKGRNNVKIGFASTTNLRKNSTIEIKKRQLFKQINLKGSPKYGQEPKLKLARKKL
ncbi:unnamed protein product [Moneuplotes crassus]|uniref:Uncharacterized protein n=1 Tax=Euplotes crassus TaxID=5936 RepID=A0AAD1UHZ7_EUPCR|nr:unnamed protein product [Moneuplotes crassus]